ncbi:MAG: hypothetical protein L0332_10425 [Chloroflexi bacterium]|nr:hypothetical protein [Chloroflexota bacterium]MCI0576082.1 hypothetical protein [Chloroflexota bacterium]MCI0647870.1 hypothetical protein [Chloroflexota bacterium]MCI0727121.1 hypothetical protein [Chloroflexota bacterium]
MYRKDRAAGLAALNELFRSGQAPEPPLHGRYRGELVALDIAPGLTQLLEWLLRRWLPWQGKTFDNVAGRGDNIFTRDSYLLARLFWPLYRGYVADEPGTYRAFAFRTYAGPGQADPDRQVMKIDYDLPGNPVLSVRHVLDELVQIGDGTYLGKAHLRWWRGKWQLVAYFALYSNSNSKLSL